MKYSVNKQDRYTIFQLEEEKLDSVVAQNLKLEIIKLSVQGVVNLILDLSQLRWTSEEGLSAILRVNDLIKPNGIFALAGPIQSQVRYVIEIAHLDRAFYIASSKEDAIAYIFREELRQKSEEKEEEDK